jgi:hypothetical protein
MGYILFIAWFVSDGIFSPVSCPTALVADTWQQLWLKSDHISSVYRALMTQLRVHLHIATAGAAVHPKTTDPTSWEVEVPW